MFRTGVFIAAMCEVKRVKVEGEVDFFQTMHQVHMEEETSHDLQLGKTLTHLHSYSSVYYRMLNLLDSHYTI